MHARAFALVLAASLFAASLAAAQDVKIQAKPPAGEPKIEIIPPGGHYEQTRPTDRDFYPDGPRVEHDPAFIQGLSGEYQIGESTGRAGVSGWTSPNTPVGPEVAGWREVTGWFGFGFSMTWGGPPRVARRPAP
jgi:hypothetical protein